MCVTVPPRLAPLAFPKGTRAGMRAQATCLVQEGDQPLTLSWQKDGQTLDPRLDIRTSQIDPYTSMMVIESATAAHSGNYTCTATNAARATTSTARLTVSGRAHKTTPVRGTNYSVKEKLTGKHWFMDRKQ